jgi:hypothetical protein
MPITKNTKKVPESKGTVEIDNSIRDYGVDPYFVKKAEEAKKFLAKAGLPKTLKAKKKGGC